MPLYHVECRRVTETISLVEVDAPHKSAALRKVRLTPIEDRDLIHEDVASFRIVSEAPIRALLEESAR